MSPMLPRATNVSINKKLHARPKRIVLSQALENSPSERSIEDEAEAKYRKKAIDHSHFLSSRVSNI